MDTEQLRRQIPEIQFRVLIIGRANAGKTSILQRICDTTESPVIYRRDKVVRGPTLLFASLISLPARLNLTRPWTFVTIVLHLIASEHRASEANTRSTTNLCSPIIRVTFSTILVGSNLVAQRNSRFYKSSFGASVEKAACVIDCTRYGLDSRVVTIATTDCHILRYCVPMDNQRPQLDLKFYKDICPDANGAPLWTLMTKFNTLLGSSRHYSFHKI